MVSAQNLVAYYQIGGDEVPWVGWDTYVVDAETVVRDRQFIKYKSFRITARGSDTHQELRVDCKTRQRGPANETAMYSTYRGTLSGEEVRAACELATAKGIQERK
jgi:hypothetical protein